MNHRDSFVNCFGCIVGWGLGRLREEFFAAVIGGVGGVGGGVGANPRGGEKGFDGLRFRRKRSLPVRFSNLGEHQ